MATVLSGVSQAVKSGAQKAIEEKKRDEIAQEDQRILEAALAAVPRKEAAARSSSDTAGLKRLIDQGTRNAVEQSNRSIDYATERAVEELRRSQEEAQSLFDTQRRQNELSAAQASDNAALYAQLRGDRGGIGQTQYDSIQNQAAANRLLISNAQTKLATDTARQIQELRAMGEFEKADAALRLSQERLAQLVSLEQWAARFNLDEYQLQSQIQRWQAELEASMREKERSYDLDLARLIGSLPDGTPTLAGRTYADEQAAKLLDSLIKMGIAPTAAQVMDALDVTEEQARQFAAAAALQIAAAKKGKSSAGGTGGQTGADEAYESVYEKLYKAGITTLGDAYDYLMNKMGYSVTATQRLSSHYMTWYKEKAQGNGDEHAADPKTMEYYLHMAATLPNSVYRSDFLQKLYTGGKVSRNQLADMQKRLGLKE